MRVSITRRLLAITAAFAAAAAGGGLLIAGGITASANTGTVIATESCSSWAVTVSLDNNVVESDTVDVLTTIPGTTGLTSQHYDTTHAHGLTEIWSAGAAVPPAVSGTVTLDIYSEGNSRTPEFTTSASIAPAEGCSTPTPAPPPTLTITTTCGGGVYFVNGTPGVTLTVYGPGSPFGWAGEEQTGAQGNGTIQGLVPGTYKYSYGSVILGEFTIVACATPTPTPVPTATPTPAPTPPTMTAPPACTDCGRG
jgi:hypothetical protein